MARDAIDLQYLVYDMSDSIGTAAITKQAVTQANGITIKNAFAGKDNSIKIIIENTSSSDTTATFKAGDKQNACLGDSIIAIAASSTAVVAPLRDMARYEKADGSIDIDFASGFTGNIYAVAEKAGL